MSKIMKNVVLTGKFSSSRDDLIARLCNLGIKTLGSVGEAVDTVVVGNHFNIKLNRNAKIDKAKHLNIRLISETVFVMELKTLEIKQMTESMLHLPKAPVADNQPRYDWNVGDTCWASNDEGHAISDESFEFVGDDVTLEILSLYDHDGTPMSVVRRHPQGTNKCFRVDMLRPIKSKRDKTIDRAVEASAIPQTGFLPNYHRKIIERLYDAGMLKD